jgi:hypothetical protein
MFLSKRALLLGDDIRVPLPTGCYVRAQESHHFDGFCVFTIMTED